MTDLHVDTAVLGAGTAGLAAYRAARAAGKSVVLIEGGPHGTTCARVGCMPSKLLIAAAEAAHSLEKFADFGLRLSGDLAVDGAAVMQRVRSERDRFVGFVVEGVEKIPAQDKLTGFARFTGPNTLVLDHGQVVNFATAVIATGSSPQVPAVLRAAGERLLVNDDVFAWQTLPASVAVFGPGVIGLELGQALSRLGVRVRVFGRGGIGGGLTDPAIRTYAEKTFRREFALDCNARLHALSPTPTGVLLSWTGSDGRDEVEEFEYLIAATGRTPNVARLGLEHTGLALQDDGVPVFDRHTLQCGTSNIFIAGDVNADVPLLHEAADEGRIAGGNAATWPQVTAGLRRSALSVVFSDPQIATVGQRFADIDAAIRVTGAVSFEDQGRSRVMLRNRGLLHVYADARTGRFLGAEMIGPDMEHIAHLLAWAHQAGMTIATMLDMPFYHPVIEEGLRTALRDAAAGLQTRAEAGQVAA